VRGADSSRQQHSRKRTWALQSPPRPPRNNRETCSASARARAAMQIVPWTALSTSAPAPTEAALKADTWRALSARQRATRAGAAHRSPLATRRRPPRLRLSPSRCSGTCRGADRLLSDRERRPFDNLADNARRRNGVSPQGMGFRRCPHIEVQLSKRHRIAQQANLLRRG
jgi:hypothetical protein